MVTAEFQQQSILCPKGSRNKPFWLEKYFGYPQFSIGTRTSMEKLSENTMVYNT
jgi:hypothetical protein